ncbi:F-box/kelch-repeat protein At3g23880-like [Bidens hawaiensis]|uniref:F-box/kelch-repeat protein At3g23880-like n=1 Tax=Bidens hawaiensis TaxID=980011 RepID=UPI0040495432
MELCYKGPSYDYLLVSNSCNGLTLVCYERDPCKAGIYRFAVIDIVSKQRHDLPPLAIRIKPCDLDLDGPCNAAGIGFDDSTNTLKTVFVVAKTSCNKACAMVHSLGTSSWRKLAQVPDYIIYGEGVFGHGRLHWLTFDCEEKTKIVWFDVKTEIFGLMGTPKSNGNVDDFEQLVDLNGIEVGFTYIGFAYIKMWILKQEKEWVLHCCFDQLSLIKPRYFVGVLGFWNKDGDILLSSNRGERLFVYALKSGHLREVDQGDSCNVSEFRMCQSSLFSLHASASLFP